MNLYEALKTAKWLLEREVLNEGDPEQVLRIRQLRDVVFMIYAAVGIPEILLQIVEGGNVPGTQ